VPCNTSDRDIIPIESVRRGGGRPRFVDRREGCDRVRGDRDGTNEVSRELRKLCGGMDKELVQLKKKYAANSTIMQILNQFEVGIELAEAPAQRK
jgi:hypothetical protein